MNYEATQPIITFRVKTSHLLDSYSKHLLFLLRRTLGSISFKSYVVSTCKLHEGLGESLRSGCPQRDCTAWEGNQEERNHCAAVSCEETQLILRNALRMCVGPGLCLALWGSGLGTRGSSLPLGYIPQPLGGLSNFLTFERSQRV